MKNLILTLLAFHLVLNTTAQTFVCNPSGNLMMFTNYDGGNLNINVNVNIPNLKIGIVSYEAMTITLSGTYLNNVTGVAYAGYNSVNSTHCGSVAIATTTITGAPIGVTPTITILPPSPLTNVNGDASIVCGYSCSTTTNQGGCNTIDQIEAYFHNVFPLSVLYAHNVQYGCWTGTQNVSAGGTCCTSTVGVETNLQNNLVTVLPNPASEFIEIKTSKDFTPADYFISDVLGNVVITGKLTEEISKVKTSGLAEGIYFLSTGALNNQTKIVIKR